MLLLASIILSGSLAHALSYADQQDCKMTPIQSSSYVSASIKQQNYDLCITNKTNIEAAATLRSQLSTLKNQEPQCFKDDRNVFGRLFNKTLKSPTSADVERCDKERQDKENQLAALDKSIADQGKQIKSDESSYNALKDSTKMTAEQRAQTDAIVQKEFDSMKLSMFDSKLQAADSALKLTKMATALDNSAMGLYLRERMAGVLNSPAMCAAVKDCPNGGNVKGSDLNSVFNSTINTGVNSEYEATSSAPAGKSAPTKGTAK